jgi:hypothetical protein
MSDEEALQAQVDAQQARIAELEAEIAAQGEGGHGNGDGDGDGKSGRHRRHGHRVLVILLLVLGMVLTPITLVALFVKTEVTDTSRYVQNVKPLSADPAIQAFVANDVTNRLFAQVNVKSYVQEALPTRAEQLAGPITSAIQGFVRDATMRVLQSAQFQRLWENANRIAHSQLVSVLTGRGGGAVTANANGQVSVDVSSVVQLVQQQLQATGIDLFSRIPVSRIGGQIPIFQSQDLYKVRHAVSLLNTLAFVLPFVVLACFGGAIILSRNRRKGFIAAAFAFALGALFLALVLAVGRSVYLNAATSNALPYDAAAAVYDTLLRFLHTSIRAVLTFSVVVLIAVIFAGPSRLAVWFRSSARRLAAWLGKESDQAGWKWLSARTVVVQHKGLFRTIAAAVAFLLLFRWTHPTPAVVLWVAVALLAVLAIIEYLGREPTATEIA